MRGINYSLIALEKMQGIEFVLLHVQDPILYVIRKQKRHSPTMTTAIANYYIIAGVVYQAPDLQSVIQSKMLTSIHYLQSAFEECFQYAKFHPSNDYYWDFAKDNTSTLVSANSDVKKEDKDKKKEISIEEASNAVRNMYRVDVLMRELVKKFPPKTNPPSNANTAGQSEAQSGNDSSNKSESAPAGDNNNSTNAINNIKTEPEDDFHKFNNKNPPPNSGGPPTKKLKLN